MPFRDAIREISSGFHRDERPNKNLRPEDPYLSYHDICLTKEDIDCLKNDWLTDNNISFWEEYLEHEQLSKQSNSNIILLRPSMAFLLKSTYNPLSLVSALPNVRDASHIFLPINDCRNPAIPEGGSHWSLLVVGIRDQVAFHYDSLSPANYTEAQIVVYKLEPLLQVPLRLRDIETPQQDNGSDCGVHVCWAMKYLLMRRLLAVQEEREVNMSLVGKRVDANGVRREMLKVCESLRKKASRSQSPKKTAEGRTSPPRIGNEKESVV